MAKPGVPRELGGGADEESVNWNWNSWSSDMNEKGWKRENSQCEAIEDTWHVFYWYGVIFGTFTCKLVFNGIKQQPRIRPLLCQSSEIWWNYMCGLITCLIF